MVDNDINNKTIKDLLILMEQLRDKESGCPWDVKQNFDTIAPYTLEEAYEVVDAIQIKDMEALKSELGDLLFQIVFQSQLAKEENLFTFDDVVTTIHEKLTRRHPHVFAGEKVKEEDLAKRWEAAKKSETTNGRQQGVLNDINLKQPSMSYAYKIQKKASSVGFDWKNLEPVLDKLDEEVDEMKQEVSIPNNQLRIEEELGDVLFSCINVARHLDINPESALRSANYRFIHRFNQVEKRVRDEGGSIESCSLQELEQLWCEAKKNK